MGSNLPPFAALRAFEAVGRLGGIRRAAKSLGVSHAIVSRHLRALEEELSTALLDRESGQLTSVGADYHSRLARVFAELHDATDAVRGRTDGKLVITCAHGLAFHWLAVRLAGARSIANMPDVDLRSQEGESDLSQNGADGDIRYLRDGSGTVRRRGERMIELARPTVFPVAAPQLLEELGARLHTVEDLVSMPLIEEGGDAEWQMWMKHQGVETPVKARAGRYGHAHLALAAARAGQGFALGNHFILADDLQRGALVRVKPMEGEFRPVALGAYVFRGHSSRWKDPSLARFRRWLQREFDADPAERG